MTNSQTASHGLRLSKRVLGDLIKAIAADETAPSTQAVGLVPLVMKAFLAARGLATAIEFGPEVEGLPAVRDRLGELVVRTLGGMDPRRFEAFLRANPGAMTRMLHARQELQRLAPDLKASLEKVNAKRATQAR